MSEPVFFERGPGLTIREIAALTGARLRDSDLRDIHITNIAALDRAGPNDLTFFERPKLREAAGATYAGACLTTEPLLSAMPPGVITLACAKPYQAFVAVGQALFPRANRPSSLFENAGISPHAHVHPLARLESGVTVDPGAVIGPRAEVGAGTLIGSTVVIGPDVRIGRDCRIGAGATITHALIGDRVILHAGCRIGQDGFGFIPGPKGHQKIPQLGRVIVQDDVEIGANSTIDRGATRDTTIGEGTKIDNLVQIAHNVSIGRHCVIASQSGISGSTVVGDYALFGGQSGIADNVTIGEGARIAARSGMMSYAEVPPGARWGGTPAGPAREWLRGVGILRRMARREGASGGEETGE